MNQICAQAPPAENALINMRLQGILDTHIAPWGVQSEASTSACRGSITR